MCLPELQIPECRQSDVDGDIGGCQADAPVTPAKGPSHDKDTGGGASWAGVLARTLNPISQNSLVRGDVGLLRAQAFKRWTFAVLAVHPV